MQRGSVQLVPIGDIDETIATAKERLEQALTMIENLNESFIREARAINTQGFEGEFYESFTGMIDEEENLTKQLNVDNLNRVRHLTNKLDAVLVETSLQEYTYESRLVPLN